MGLVPRPEVDAAREALVATNQQAIAGLLAGMATGMPAPRSPQDLLGFVHQLSGDELLLAVRWGAHFLALGYSVDESDLAAAGIYATKVTKSVRERIGELNQEDLRKLTTSLGDRYGRLVEILSICEVHLSTSAGVDGYWENHRQLDPSELAKLVGELYQLIAGYRGVDAKTQETALALAREVAVSASDLYVISELVGG